MTKYDFSNNNHEEIDLPSIIKINKSLISITHASGTDYKNIPDEGNLEIQIGNIGSYDPPSPDPEPTPGPDPDPDPLPDPGPDPDPLPTPLYVDLGLPSGTLWATGNIIKSNGNYSIGNPTDKGCYFSWANIDGYNDTEYIFSRNNYNQTPGGLYEISQNENIQRSSIYDAATAKLGSNYMLPTVEQAQELTSYCSKSVETINEIDVLKFTSTINGNYIYIPFAGYYDADDNKTPDITHNDCRFWTSIAYAGANPDYARHYVAYTSQTEGFCSDAHRYKGFPIRAIFVNN